MALMAVLSATVILSLSCATSSEAEQIVNGGFELPALPPGTIFLDMTGNSMWSQEKSRFR